MNRKDQLKYLDQDLLSHLSESMIYLYFNLESLKKTFGRDIRKGDKVTYTDHHGEITRYLKIKDIIIDYPDRYPTKKNYIVEGYLKSKRRNCHISFLVYKTEKRFSYIELTVKHNHFYLLNNNRKYTEGYGTSFMFLLTKNKVYDLFNLVRKENFVC